MAFLPLVRRPEPAEDDRMFSAHCSGHGSDVLLTARAVERLINTDHGIELHWRCHCGTAGVILTGRRVAPEVSAAFPAGVAGAVVAVG